MTQLPSYSYSMLLPKAYRTLRAKAYQVLSEHDLTPTHWSLVGIVYGSHAAGFTVTELAKRLSVKMPLVTVMVDLLVKKGIVERVVNEKDSRSKLVRATEKGAHIVEAIQEEVRIVMDPLFVDVTDEEMAGFQTVLEKIIKNDAA